MSRPAGGGELVLRGGITNAGEVSRVGDTVRRPVRPTSPATERLLRHLEVVGFDGAPRFLGHDERGREVLSYVEGEAAIDPVPGWALTDAALESVADLLRRYHAAVASFEGAGGPWPAPVPEAFRSGLVSHNDPNLDNVVFRDGRAVALIDFDLAGPGSAVWDVACAARLWAPLRDPRDAPPAVRGRALERLRRFADAYGLATADRGRLVDALGPAHEHAYDVVRAAVAEGHPAFGRLWHGGGRTRAERTRRWLADHDGALRAALTD